MSAGALTLHTSAKLAILQGQLDLATAKLQVVLLTAAYVPAAAHVAYSDISNNEVSGATGTGYTTGGQALAGQSVAASGAGAIFTASPSSWPAASMAPQYAVLVEMAGTSLAPTDKLIGYLNLNADGGAVAVADAPFTITWPSSGILALN